MNNATLQSIIKQLHKLCTGQEEIKNNAHTGQEELRKHIRDVCADLKTEESVACKDIEDKLEKSVSTTSAGQEELKSDMRAMEKLNVTETH